MKHSLKVTLLLAALFLITQTVGLTVIQNYINPKATQATGQLTYETLPYSLERPAAEPTTTLAFILLAVILGTATVLLLIRFRKTKLWKAWFFLSVTFCLAIAFSAFINEQTALVLALVLAAIKIFRQNIYVHNITEIFVYGGLAAIFVPIINARFALILLLVISAYDIIAVWKTKHMVKMAKFQTNTKLFAGLLVPYKATETVSKKVKAARKIQTAILGGGDMAFPLIFAGAVMQQTTFIKALIVPAVATAALMFLLLKSEKGKFYPAMPFITIGCIIGYAIVLIA